MSNSTDVVGDEAAGYVGGDGAILWMKQRSERTEHLEG